MRLGIACGLLCERAGQITFSERFLHFLCKESKRLATQEIGLFLENGWSELLFAAGAKAKDPAVIVGIDEFEDLLLHGLALPLTRYLADVAAETELLTVDADESMHATEELETELWEMSLELERPEDVRPFIVRAYIELANARLLLFNPARLDHCHLLALFLFLAFKDLHVAALEYVLTQPGKHVEAKETS